MARVMIGTSGFTLQRFYPESVAAPQRLAYYAQHFSSVEINSTFYHMPRPSTIEKWLASVPSSFVFSFKVFQGVTRFEANYQKVLDHWLNVYASFIGLSGKLVMLLQFPASFSYDPAKLKYLQATLPDTFIYAFEFRHKSWFCDEVYDQILAKGSTIVLAESAIWPKFDLGAADFSYIRFHGAPKLYDSSYSRTQLAEYAKLIKQKIAAGKDVYVYFNNDIRAHAAKNAQTLIQLLDT